MLESIDPQDIYVPKIGKTVHQIILDLSSDPIFAFDKEGHYLYVNNAFAKPFKLSPMAIMGKKIWDIFPGEQGNQRFAAVKKAFETGEEVNLEVKVEQPNTPLYFITTVTPIKDEQGEVHVVICISKNITSRMEMEQKLHNAKILTEQRNTELDQMVKELYEKSIKDSLTNTFNRHHSLHLLENEIVKAKSQGMDLTLLMIDIDYFKRTNDQFGHLTGDEVLIAICREMNTFFQEIGFVGRYGGDEFIVILPFVHLNHGIELATELLKRIETLAFSSDDLRLTLSCGLSQYQHETLNEFIKLADDRLYLAKDQGRNRVVFQ